MKKIFITIFLFAVCSKNFSQWQLSLTFENNESLAAISSPNESIIWAISGSFIIYRTTNGGNNWKRIKPAGLSSNISLSELYAVNASMAFLSVSENTGIGPGIIYKTIDGGKTWSQVFTHKGTCEFVMGMFNENEGIMSCSFDSFTVLFPRGRLYIQHQTAVLNGYEIHLIPQILM